MNLFGTSSIIIFFASIGFAAFTYFGNKKSKLTRSWLILSIPISLWGLGLYGVTSITNKETALLFQYLLDISAIFIPICYFNFILTFLNLEYRWVRFFSYLLATGFALFSFSPLFKDGLTIKFGFNWINAGPYYFIFPLYFIGAVLISLALLGYRYLKENTDPEERKKILLQILAGAIGFSGGVTNFFPQLFNIYPFGNYFIILYLFFMSYGVLKYNFFSTKIISAQLFSGAIVLLFLFNLLTQESLEGFFIQALLLAGVSISSLLLVRGVYRVIEAQEEIQKLNEQLKILDLKKSKFVSLASHELRSPLTAIKGYASLILEGSYGEVPKSVQETVERIFKSSEDLAIMLEDFLNISRIEQGKMKYDFTLSDLKQIVTQAFEEQKINATKKKLQLTFATDAAGKYPVLVDRGKIKQVVMNLIDNAIKYTPAGSVQIHLSRNGELGIVRLEISDTGVGISPETMELLFKEFSRAEGANKVNVMGTGLGLYLAREFMAAHNGKIWAESKGNGRGSTFIIELHEADNATQIAALTQAETKPREKLSRI